MPAPVAAPAKKSRAKPVAMGDNAGVETPAGDVTAPTAPAKKPRAKRGAPIEAETQVLESSPVAAEAAAGTQAADAPVKKPRAKKIEG